MIHISHFNKKINKELKLWILQFTLGQFAAESTSRKSGVELVFGGVEAKVNDMIAFLQSFYLCWKQKQPNSEC